MTAEALAGLPPSAGKRRFPPSRPYWGWVMVGALGVTTCVSYGTLAYAFSVFLAPMEAELGWSRAQLTGAFSAAWLVAGLSAIPLGRWVDRHGARLSMTSGSLLAATLLLGWSRVNTLAGFYAIWLGIGVASAAVLYEPAFAVVASWFERRRSSALTALTFLGGLASVIFVPLAGALVSRLGWREALVWLACILAGITVPAHALLLRRRPQDLGLLPDGRAPALPTANPEGPIRAMPSVATREAIRSRSFLYLALAFGLAALASTTITVHLVPLLLERGFSGAAAAGAMGLVGLMALPGRLVFTPLGGYWPRGAVTASIFVLQALSALVLLIGRGDGAVWAFVALFGAGFGAITPARAGMIAELYGPGSYASISGVLAVVLAGAAACAPIGASLLRSASGSYTLVVGVMLATSITSGILALAAGRRPQLRSLPLELAA